MSKKTKVAILILVIALIIVLAIGTISIINSFKSDDTGAEALNETQIKIFVDCNIGKADSSGDSEILKTLKEKDRGIFIIYKR